MANMRFKVSVRCSTYNQSKYIKDTMDGFCMQETNFPYVCTIVDDASTDGEQVVIKEYIDEHFLADYQTSETEYAHIITAQHKKNRNCHFVVLFLKENLYSKGPIHSLKRLDYIREWENVPYIAFCEGDDYWVSPHKLQLQVDQLDANPNYMMVYTDYQTVDMQGNVLYRKEYEEIKKYSSTGDILPLLFVRNFPMTLTLLFRKEVLYSSFMKKSPFTLDYLSSMSAAFKGDCCYLPEKTSCYRQNPNSLMNSRLNDVVKKVTELNKYFALEYVKGNSKKESFRNHVNIMQTICLRFMDDKEVMEQLIAANGNVRLWKAVFGVKRSVHKLLRR